jgi:hypothetical protein
MIAFPNEPIRAFNTGDLFKDGDDDVIGWGDGKVLSVQPDGRFETRPRNAIGAWERGRRQGNVVVYSNYGGPVWFVPVVDLP